MTAPTAVERRGGTDRRVQRVSIHYPERRTGFDRRDPGTTRWSRLLWWYRDRPAAVAGAAALIAVLGLTDVLLTWHLIDLGAREANPIMARLLDGGLGGALWLKAAVIVPVAAAVWTLRRYRRVLAFSLVVLAASAALVAAEALGLALLSA
jgi:hypothetical protein